MSKNHEHRPGCELRCGGLYLAIQYIPRWLVAALAAASGRGLAAWLTSR
ncbi:hypothetical protein SO3561_09183 [Streptomyces olivochromogenes]|uniref:Uncharacterized protein n=1 Tax=Streptomyces olivochromogenes TaxID=1963 RepID=A0A250VTS3_STROL|nr:hypothetical protein SO3561_09183 [Streptomyces olivochromogenes]